MVEGLLRVGNDRSGMTTLKQIAEKAGVSVTTVSRILRGERLNTFAQTTIDRVNTTAAVLKYRPNLMVSGMQRRGTRTVGVIMPTHGDYYRIIFAGIHDALAAKDYVPIVVWPQTQGLHAECPGRSELELIHALVDRRVEGVILKPAVDNAGNDYFGELFERKIPVVIVDRPLPRVDAPFVGTDNRLGTRLALRHLVELGHKKLGFYGVRSDVSTGMERYAEFKKFVRENPQITGVEILEDTWFPSSANAAKLWAGNWPTAIFTATDSFAFSLMQAATQLGIEIPDDLSVVGFGHTMEGFYLAKELTTVDQEPYQIGAKAVDALFRQLDPDGIGNAEMVPLHPPKLHLGASTGKPR